LGDCADAVIRERPRIVGFTSVFQQHTGSLALAKRLKEAAPDVWIVFGGANVEGVMGAETLKCYPFVDAVVSGEADLVFPSLVKSVLEGAPFDGLPGVHLQITQGRGQASHAPMVTDMDSLPYPDYSDYFSQFWRSRFGNGWTPNLYFETSRGCWWGEKQHCTFCGLNGDGMKYRSKSGKRALSELREICARYPDSDIQITDNILDMSYFDDFILDLASDPLDVVLFYETKANLSRRQIRQLREAGIRMIQPGIESLSDSILKLMRKGVTAIQNIRLLKWCRELGVVPHWNFLWGFPGEDPSEYSRMKSLIPALAHLPPPSGGQMIRLDRFSPNFFDAHRLGLKNLTPVESYRYVHRSVRPEALQNLAYYFSFEYAQPQDVDSYVQPLARELNRWRKAYESSEFVMREMGGELEFWDSRFRRRHFQRTLDGIDRDVYLLTENGASITQIAREIGRPLSSVENVVERLVTSRFVVRDGRRCLGLAIRLDEYRPSERLRAVLAPRADRGALGSVE
jgi:ribosomal peptide maturation radical SAM protein 1